VLYIPQGYNGWQLFRTGVSCNGLSIDTPLSSAIFISNNGNTGITTQKFFCSEGMLSIQNSYSPQIACDGSDTCIIQTPNNNGEVAFFAIWGDPNGHLCPTLVSGNDGDAFSNALCACSTFNKVPTCTSCASTGNYKFDKLGMNACTPSQFPTDCCILHDEELCNPPNYYSTCSQTCCSPVCTDTQTDANNCGGCSLACVGTATCTGGVCSSLSCGSGSTAFNSPCAWTATPASDSFIVADHIHLTSNRIFQHGQVYNPTVISLFNNYQITFSYTMTPCTTTPSEGLAFLFVSALKGAGPYSLGGNGGGLGYSGLTETLAIEFDVFKNSFDPDCHHVAIQSCGNAANSADHTGSCKIGLASLASVTDIQGDHTVVVQYNAVTSTIQVTLDTVLVLTASYNMVQNFGTGNAYFAFTGTTSNTDSCDMHITAFSVVNN